MSEAGRRQRYEVVVIGGGQAGLAAGYHLRRRGIEFVILDARERIGDAWRARWDSLRLFTPAAFNGLPGKRFPAAGDYFPTKNEMADFLEGYAADFELPVRTGTRVDRLAHGDDGFVVSAGEQHFEADNVIVAMANFQEPRVPAFADELDDGIRQIHSSDYRSPSQIRTGSVLVVGAGNSGAEIALELARDHPVQLSGRHTGELPFRLTSVAGRRLLLPVLLRFAFRKVLTVRTLIGRRVRPRVVSKGGPLIRVRKRDLDAAGVEWMGRTDGVRDGMPVVEDDRRLEVANVIWCTGFRTGFESWIDLPVHGDLEPVHQSGVVVECPGLYFLGLHFLHSLASVMIHGVGEDAGHIARHIERHGQQGH